MQEIKELKFEELTLEQKFGLVLTLNPCGYMDLYPEYEWAREENEFLFKSVLDEEENDEEVKEEKHPEK